MKSNKVYEVRFGMVEGKNDYINVDSKKVLAKNVQEAVILATELLNKKEAKMYYVDNVELLVILS